jgi:nucleoside-diphosphate-sugar epimerase
MPGSEQIAPRRGSGVKATRLSASDADLTRGFGEVDWEALRGARVLVTGGTGFVGAWLADTLLGADDRLGLGVRLHLLTRSPQAVAARLPWLAADRRVDLLAGDVVDCAWPDTAVTHVIAGAASADAAVNARDPQGSHRTIVEGTRRTLEASLAYNDPRILVVSSGAVYGAIASGQPAREDDPLPAFPTAPGYHSAKRGAEAAATSAAERGQAVTIARLFAFVGPYLPADKHFAVGNFVADAARGGPIVVRGDGTPVRSYLYGADMAFWLWTILVAGRRGEAYNVGSRRALRVSEVATLVARAVDPPASVEIRGASSGSAGPAPTGGGGEWYVPSTAKALEELGLREWTTLEEGIAKMLDWHAGGRAQ